MLKRSQMYSGLLIEYEGMRIETRGTWKKGIVRSVPDKLTEPITIIGGKTRIRRFEINIRPVQC